MTRVGGRDAERKVATWLPPSFTLELTKPAPGRREPGKKKKVEKWGLGQVGQQQQRKRPAWCTKLVSLVQQKLVAGL